MRITTPPLFGIISGFSTTLGLLPHLLVLSFLMTARKPPPIAFLIAFTIIAKLLCEWVFWTMSAKRMDQEKRLSNWRTMANKSLISNHNVFVALVLMSTDALVEVLLISIALKTSLSPVLILITFLGCQALSAPIQGFASDCFSQKQLLLFASSMGLLVVAVAGEIISVTEQNSSFLINLLSLSSFTSSVQMIIILCAKGVLGNTPIIARAAIAEAIKFKTIAAAKE